MGLYSGAIDVLFPHECLCCASRDIYLLDTAMQLCRVCLQELHKPWRVADIDVGFPVFVAGSYGGVRRSIVLAMKDRLVPQAIHIAGALLQAGLWELSSRGCILDPHVKTTALLPAPTRASAARSRGGDVVFAMAEAYAARKNNHDRCVYSDQSRVSVVAAATIAEEARDSVGLGRVQRRRNISKNIRFDEEVCVRLSQQYFRGDQMIIVDDVVTTGATLKQFSLGLAARGIYPQAAVVIASA